MSGAEESLRLRNEQLMDDIDNLDQCIAEERREASDIMDELLMCMKDNGISCKKCITRVTGFQTIIWDRRSKEEDYQNG